MPPLFSVMNVVEPDATIRELMSHELLPKQKGKPFFEQVLTESTFNSRFINFLFHQPLLSQLEGHSMAHPSYA